MGAGNLNDKRRNLIRGVKTALEDIESRIDIIRDDEEESLDNIPENLQYGDRYERIEAAVDALNDALELVDQLQDKLDDAIIC